MNQTAYRPRIALPLPTSGDPAYNRGNLKDYLSALAAAGADALEVDLSAQELVIRNIAAACDAILLPGSPADVAPELYGQPREEACAPADPAREAADRLLLDAAFAANKPILGICFGVQMLNTYCGGTLLQDLAPVPVNHSAGKSVLVAHSAELLPGSFLAQQAGRTRVDVNSSHHQAIGICAPDLHIVARCPIDGVVEAVEGPAMDRHFVLGVQWHPERTAASDQLSRAIFQALAQRAQAWRAAQSR